MKSTNLLKVVFVLSIILIAEKALSMAPPPPPPPAAGGPVVPIDGGIGLLLAAGVGYGAKKYYDLKKKNKEDNIE
ncbi:MAG: PID-CTERM protein-sorting domain-containing protein [Bacteroidia bacterium]